VRRVMVIGLIMLLILQTVLNIGCKSPVNSVPVTIKTGAAMLEFSLQPVGAKALSPLSVQPVVIIEDAFGDLVNDSAAKVTMSIVGGTPEAILYGDITIQAVNGVANFTNLSIDLAGPYYSLIATSSGLSPASSEMFNISAR
jgi:hypothetical protein